MKRHETWLPCPGHSSPYFEGRVEIQEDAEYAAGGQRYREYTKGSVQAGEQAVLSLSCVKTAQRFEYS